MHLQDQVPKLGLNQWPSRASGATLPPPVQTKSAAVPPDHRLRPHEDEGLAPTRPKARQPGPEHAVRGPKSHPPAGALAFEDDELMAKGQDFSA